MSDAFPIHDILVIAYLLHPSLFTTQKLYVDVETGGAISRGQTMGDFRNRSPFTPQMDACLGIDAESVLDLFLDRVTQPTLLF